MTNHEREVENILLNLRTIAENHKEPTAYMLGVAVSILGTLALEDSRNARTILRAIKKNLTPGK